MLHVVFYQTVTPQIDATGCIQIRPPLWLIGFAESQGAANSRVQPICKILLFCKVSCISQTLYKLHPRKSQISHCSFRAVWNMSLFENICVYIIIIIIIVSWWLESDPSRENLHQPWREHTTRGVVWLSPAAKARDQRHMCHVWFSQYVQDIW